MDCRMDCRTTRTIQGICLTLSSGGQKLSNKFPFQTSSTNYFFLVRAITILNNNSIASLVKTIVYDLIVTN